jgi:hypothetical protein
MACSSVNASDWLALQEYQANFIEPKGVKIPYRSKIPKLWGFIQASWRYMIKTINLQLKGYSYIKIK